MNNSLALITETEYNTVERMARTLFASGLLPKGANSPEKAMAIILLGRELSVAPWQAISTINVIDGKPTISPQLMLALIEASGQSEDMKITDDGNTCTVIMTRKGRSPHTETFSMQDAVALNLDGKYNWKQQPKTMRKWRTVAACARVVYPDVILGLYTPEEMGADVTVSDSGEMSIVDVPRHAPVATNSPPVTSSENTNVASTPLIEAGNGSSETVDEIIEGETVEEIDSADALATKLQELDADIYECFGVIPQPVKGGNGSFMYVCKCKDGTNITVFGGDKFREAGLHPDEWKKNPNKITKFNDPIIIVASLVGEGDKAKWEIHTVKAVV